MLVTHGIGFLSQCDRVVSLKEGRIAEVGTYAELIDQDGPFAEFIRHHSGGTDVEEDLPGIHVAKVYVRTSVCMRVLM